MERLPQIQRIGFWRRLVAALLDSFFLLLLFIPITLLTYYVVPKDQERAIHSVTCGLVTLLYFSFEMITAASLGKIITGLEITCRNGTEASFARLLNRWTLKWSWAVMAILATVVGSFGLQWLANLMEVMVLIGCFAALGESHLAWHDRVAETAVYRVRDVRQPSGSVLAMPDADSQRA